MFGPWQTVWRHRRACVLCVCLCVCCVSHLLPSLRSVSWRPSTHTPGAAHPRSRSSTHPPGHTHVSAHTSATNHTPRHTHAQRTRQPHACRVHAPLAAGVHARVCACSVHASRASCSREVWILRDSSWSWMNPPHRGYLGQGGQGETGDE